jgi:hypothetical protein
MRYIRKTPQDNELNTKSWTPNKESKRERIQFVTSRKTQSPKALIEAEKLFDEGFGYVATARQLALSQYTVRDWLDKQSQARAIGLGRMTTHKNTRLLKSWLPFSCSSVVSTDPK